MTAPGGNTSPETRTERQKMLAGELYLSSDPELQVAMVRSMRLTKAYNQISVDELDRRTALLHELLGSFGSGSRSSKDRNRWSVCGRAYRETSLATS